LSPQKEKPKKQFKKAKAAACPNTAKKQLQGTILST